MDPFDSAVSERLKAVPHTPGVYLFKDARSKVLYVGKAQDLPDRLRAYFGKQENLPDKIQRMVSRASDFEYLVTHSVSEALILENTLIKHHKPPYNTRLRDDKTYPYIKIDLKEDFPLVYFTRRVQNDGARYFGPFAGAGSVRQTLDLLKRLFPYRSCTKPITGKDERPCLEYYIHRCVAPCVGYASKEEYRQVIDQVLLFLEGKTETVLAQLQEEMQKASTALRFERAAVLRDEVRAVQRVSEEQKVVSTKRKDMDIVALLRARDEAWVEVFFIRNGKLTGRDHFTMEGAEEEPTPRILAQFVRQYYDQASFIPPEVLLPEPVEDQALVQEWLAGKRQGRVVLSTPRRGERRKLLELVAENAAQAQRAAKVKLQAGDEAQERAVRELQEALSLPRPPRRIECYDISNISGSDPVGSMVVCQDARPLRSAYRRFKIKTVEQVDDYSMMQEMLRRRFSKLLPVLQPDAPKSTTEDPKWTAVPDLVLIDGGRGHLSAALQVFLELGIATQRVPLASLAKEREELFLPNVPEPIRLPRHSPALFLVQRARDEAHRFAITFHRQRRSKRQVRSVLDQVAGIGPKRRRLLLTRFGTVGAIRDASLEDLTAVPGVTRDIAQRLKEQL
ncbi:MAG: excinuclease ABC subunit UvrC [Dehalococcoidia bacterium]|nr:excinuclease ABC subunit UvrC [Dehalococcoidia bacterium]